MRARNGRNGVSAGLLYRDRRQFGRRETNIRGAAIIPGRTSRPFFIRNISDGGALLVFDDGFIPPGAFRIEVDGTEFVLLCEVRRTGADGVGISFKRVSEGAALNRHFQLRPLDSTATSAPSLPRRAQSALPPTSNLEMRTTFLIALARTFAASTAQPKRDWRHKMTKYLVAGVAGHGRSAPTHGGPADCCKSIARALQREAPGSFQQ